jgi:tetratricopeptide (TPR) repeat protein
MLKSRERLGKDHEKTIKRTLRLVGCYIAQYKLNETDQLLDEIYPVCKEKGGPLYIKCIQSRAFCMFKQYRFREALEVFHEQAKLVGPSAALYENMAHTYNSLGDYENAASFFSQAMALLEQGSYGKRGGILLGLGLVRERQGRPEEALPTLQEALEHYKKDHGNEDGTSLIAKAHMSVGQVHPCVHCPKTKTRCGGNHIFMSQFKK